MERWPFLTAAPRWSPLPPSCVDMLNPAENLADDVHRQLLAILPAGWSCRRKSEVLWFVEPPRTWFEASAPVLEYSVELLGTRIAVTHENTDAGAFTTA